MTDFLVETIWLIPLYGLIGAIFTLPWSMRLIRKTGSRPAAYFNLLMTLMSFIHTTLIFNHIWQIQTQSIIFDWFTIQDLNILLELEISPISLGALELVTGISLFTQIYAIGYLEKDWALARFFSLMGFFEAVLCGISISDSLFLTYTCLELLTLSTYLLIGFWYAQPLVVTASRDAFLTKRIGEITLLMGIVALSTYGEGLTFSELENWAIDSSLPYFTATVLGVSLIVGSIGKCAQFPLNLWLDEAMEGPNPASIMRNSVVVSAGAYVLIKLEPVFTLSVISQDVLIILGTITAIGTSLMALAQIDIKRALSHSTSAYLGLIFIAVGLDNVDVAFLLLFTHAISKALLFMSAGSVIYTTNNQNVTELGGLWSKMPATTISYVVASMGLLGLFPMGVFWSLERWFNGNYEVHWWLLGLILFVNLMSALNLTRVFRLVFLGKPHAKTRRAPEVIWLMAVPMVSLIIINLIAPLAPIKYPLWLSFVAPLQNNESFLTDYAMHFLIISGVVGVIIGMSINLGRLWTRPRQLFIRFFQDLFAYDFYLDKIYQYTFVWLVSSLSKLTSWFDRYIVDGAVNLVSLATIFSGSALKYNTSGQSQFYVFTILIGVSLLMWSILTGQWQNIVDYWSQLIINNS